LRLQWSTRALRDLQRFAEFLSHDHPDLSTHIADALTERASMLKTFPRLGSAIARRDNYRSFSLDVLGARYVVQYQIKVDGVLIVRVFHAREGRTL
jgi:plasmid stabilization system protein ParE